MKSKLDVWGWSCLCAALIAANLYPTFVPHLSNDAYQYLSVAQNTRAGHFGYTSLVHYDPERSFGVVPAPMVHFPLGYPSAIALISLFGVSLQTAALLISAISIVACLPVLAWIGSRLGLSRMLVNAVLAGFVLNARVLEFGASALSEAPFTLVVLAGVALLVSARLQTDTRRAWWRWAAAGLAFGAAYHVRYAGMFFIVGLAALFIRHLTSSDRFLAKGYAVTSSVAGAAMLVGIARNVLLVGNWQGTVDKKVSHPLPEVLVDTVRAGKVLFLGPTFDMPAWTAIVRVLFIACFFGGIGWLVWHRRIFHPRSPRRSLTKEGSRPRNRTLSPALSVPDQSRAETPRVNSIPADLLILVVTYCGIMFYAGLTTTISYEARMFVPLTPLFLLLLALGLSAMLAPAPESAFFPKPAFAALGTSFGCYVLLNVTMVVRPPTDYSPPSVAGLVDSPSPGGKTPRAAVFELADTTRVIVANYGQAVGHALGRPTVSLVGPSYTPVEWNEKAIHDVVDRFNAAAIVIYAKDISLPSPFVERLAQGEAPTWMKLVYRSSEFLVYQPLSRNAKSNGPLRVSQGPIVQK